MKIVLVFSLFFTFMFSKECYTNKVETICYDRYFDRASIYEAKNDEEYYINKYGSIYTFDNILEVRFKSIGAVFTLLNHYELEFIDKKSNELYLFKVANRRDLFPMISRINKLETVMKAEPYTQRKYTNEYVQQQQEAKKARLETVMKEAKSKLENKSTQPSANRKNVGFTVPENEPAEKKSFLKGEY